MKNLLIILLLALGACSDAKKVTILETKEKAFVPYLETYDFNDTVVVYYNGSSWKLDENWIKFEGNVFKSTIGYHDYYKAVVN